MTEDRKWEIGICGTFDVANYGDLLFPLIAESELTERLGAVALHRFSYNTRTPPDWPYEVHSVTALPRMIHHLDGMLIGGGFLIRFDKQVAPDYGPPGPEIHHPTGYWLTPALMALQHNVPTVWNAPGTDGKSIPAWANPLMEKVLTLSRYVSVRDEPSRAVLEPLSKTSIAIVPDTAFGLPRLLSLESAPSAEFTRFCEASGLNGPYIVVQAKPGLEGFLRFIRNHAERFRNFRFLALPIGPVLGDREDVIDANLPHTVRPAYWPSPLVIAELIGRAEAVAAHSYHLCITALAYGVPVFARHGLAACKYSVLQDFESYFVLPPNGEPDLEWFLTRVGRKAPCPAARTNYDALGAHWDRIAAEFRAEPVQTAPSLNRFWQVLPAMLEDASTRENEVVAALLQQRGHAEHLQEVLAATQSEGAVTRDEVDQALEQLALARGQAEETKRLLGETLGQLAQTRGEVAQGQRRMEETGEQLALAQKTSAERQNRLDVMLQQLSAARAGRAGQDARIAEIMESLSWRLTSPLRLVGRYILNRERR